MDRGHAACGMTTIMPHVGLRRIERHPRSEKPALMRRNSESPHRFDRKLGSSVFSGSITKRSASNWICFGKDFVLNGKISIQVDLGGFDRFMPEPNGDHGSIDAGLQHFHGCGVTTMSSET